MERISFLNFESPDYTPRNRLSIYFAGKSNPWFNDSRITTRSKLTIGMADNPNIERKQLYGKAVDLKEAANPEVLYISANEFAKEMLESLERKGYLSKDIIFQGCTAKGGLTLLLEETIKNAVESAAKKWKDKNYVGVQIGVVSFIENNELWVRVLDNGIGFNKEVLINAGRKSLTNKQVQRGDFRFKDSLKDHLFKMGQTALLLGWRLVVENRKEVEGGSVSVVIPLKTGAKTVY